MEIIRLVIVGLWSIGIIALIEIDNLYAEVGGITFTNMSGSSQAMIIPKFANANEAAAWAQDYKSNQEAILRIRMHMGILIESVIINLQSGDHKHATIEMDKWNNYNVALKILQDDKAMAVDFNNESSCINHARQIPYNDKIIQTLNDYLNQVISEYVDEMLNPTDLIQTKLKLFTKARNINIMIQIIKANQDKAMAIPGSLPARFRDIYEAVEWAHRTKYNEQMIFQAYNRMSNFLILAALNLKGTDKTSQMLYKDSMQQYKNFKMVWEIMNQYRKANNPAMNGSSFWAGSMPI